MNNIFPNYSVDREPTRYGGDREDYQLKSKEIIREGIKKNQNFSQRTHI
ncbi:hypothetical protein [Neochlamydia sp. AcF84]|nr:hypothetical protein [Neochlamydia sp. AcF84]